MNKAIGRIAQLFHVGIFTPKGFLIRALLICLAFLVCHLAGLREFTTFLSGTTATSTFAWSVVLGVTYIFLYLAFTVGVPILILASAFLALYNRFIRP